MANDSSKNNKAFAIVTRDPSAFIFSRKALTGVAKKFLGKVRGPEAVVASLTRGLDQIGSPFILNSVPKSVGIVHVVSDVDTLAWAIKEKNAGRIGKIIAGPTLVVTPIDANGILRDPAIDIILVPSEWVKNFYNSLAPEITRKIRVWPSGVEKTASSDKSGKPILYIKTENTALIDEATTSLNKLGTTFETLRYGNFKKSDYQKHLAHAPYLIYIGKSESQGLALHEAWVADVPTLVFNSKEWRSTIEGREYSWSDEKIAAPYLTPETGMFWNKGDSFETTFELFLAQLPFFTPADYSTKHFTDILSAQKLIEIINEISN